MAKKKQDDDETPDTTSDGSIAVNDAWTGMLAISLLALIIGAGFLAWDYMQYSDDKLPTVPKLSGSQPGGGVKPPPPIEKKDDKDKDKADEKKDDKKDAARRRDRDPLCC